MRAVTYVRTGDPSVLTVQDVPVPEPGAGEVRIRVVAASANLLDAKLRSGRLAYPQTFPVIPGMDAAGIVDAVGAGVSDVSAGDAVFGPGRATWAEYAVLTAAVSKPHGVDFVSAAAVTTTGETALRGLALTGVQTGGTVLVHGAAGGVGSIAVQLAVLQGFQVVGTAAPADLPFVRSLGARGVAYGDGWPARVRAITRAVDGVLDTSGAGVLPESVEIANGPTGVVTIADPRATDLGVHFTHASARERRYDSYPTLIELLASGRLVLRIAGVHELQQAAALHQRLDGGRTGGKLVLTIGTPPGQRVRLAGRDRERGGDQEPGDGPHRRRHGRVLVPDAAPGQELDDEPAATTGNGPCLRVLVLGANGATGRLTVRQALDRGLEVTALTRHPDDFPIRHARLDVLAGDATDPATVDRAVAGCDAVVSVIGTAYTRRSVEVYSASARSVIAAMVRHEVRRLIVVTSIAVAVESSRRDRFVFDHLAHPLLRRVVGRTLYDDMERMEAIVTATDLDWTIVRPPGLTNQNGPGYTAAEVRVAGMLCARDDLAAFLLDQITSDRFARRVAAVSSSGMRPRLLEVLRDLREEALKR